MTAALPDRLAGEALAELWSRCWKAMARAGPEGWTEVTIRLPLGDDAQRRAVAGLLGRPLRPGTQATQIRLADLDAILRRAGDGWDLPAVVEAAGGPLPDRTGDARARSAAIDAACRQARAVLPHEAWAQRWLAQLERGMLGRLHGRGQLDLVVLASRMLAQLPADGTPLPVFAARLAGDTKALAGTPLAGLVLRGLACRFEEPPPQGAAARRELWEAAGLVPDDLASQVLVLNLPVAAEGGLTGGWLAEAAANGLPFRVTLQQLARHPVRVSRPVPVHVCENPAVLRAAADAHGAASRPLVCTEGRPSVACLRLLRTLAEGGCELRYHGDFDWPGLRIASTVLQIPGARPWRFDVAAYRDALRDDRLRPGLAGAAADSPWDPGLAVAMAEAGVAVHEEEVLDLLLADLGSRPAPGDACIQAGPGDARVRARSGDA